MAISNPIGGYSGGPRVSAGRQSVESAAVDLARRAHLLRAVVGQARAGRSVSNDLARRISAYEEALHRACRKQERLRRLRSMQRPRVIADRTAGRKLADRLPWEEQLAPTGQRGLPVGAGRKEE